MGTRVFRRCAAVFLPTGSPVPPGVLSATARGLSAPLRHADGPNLALQDALNARLPWLWWPVGVPAAAATMGPGAHALYVLHAWVIARALGVPRGRAWAAGTLLSWACFTGAWDRRALRGVD